MLDLICSLRWAWLNLCLHVFFFYFTSADKNLSREDSRTEKQTGRQVSRWAIGQAGWVEWNLQELEKVEEEENLLSFDKEQ